MPGWPRRGGSGHNDAVASAAVDAVVIGGGPAGAAAARLLASWGHSVRLLAGTADRSHSLGESLPPSCRKLCDLLGVTAAIDGAGFLASTGNTVWWAEGEVRTAAFADGATGWQVVRHDLDALLLRLAADAGAEVLDGALVRAVQLAPDGSGPGPASATVEYVTAGQRRQAVVVEASFVLDCSGRAGVVARRGFRIPDAGQTTLALTAIWTQPDGWGVDDPSHTLVETYGDGWAWSVPVTATRRYVTVMVDPRVTDSGSARVLGARYEREIGKTAAMRRLLDGATRDTPAWGCDASLYHAQTCGGPGVLLVGDAASFIDPLSSYGVKKALASAWLASVVVHTSLTNASLAGVALDLFNAREQEMHAASCRQSAQFFADAAARHLHPFWTGRAISGDIGEPAADTDVDVNQLRRDPAVLSAFETLRQAPDIRLEAGRPAPHRGPAGGDDPRGGTAGPARPARLAARRTRSAVSARRRPRPAGRTGAGPPAGAGPLRGIHPALPAGEPARFSGGAVGAAGEGRPSLPVDWSRPPHRISYGPRPNCWTVATVGNVLPQYSPW